MWRGFLSREKFSQPPLAEFSLAWVSLLGTVRE